MARATLSDDELSSAAREVLEYELKLFDAFGDFPDHKFRDEIEEKMKNLCHDVEHGKIKSADYHMGFTFYAKRCITAALLIITLTGIIMPEAVQAGYQKLVEIIENVFEEYTRFEYLGTETIEEEEKFITIRLEFIPKGWRIINSEVTENSLELLYMNNQNKYFRIYQKRIADEFDVISIVNTEQNNIETILVNNEEVEVIFYEEGKICFMWVHDNYYIEGQTK